MNCLKADLALLRKCECTCTFELLLSLALHALWDTAGASA